MNLVKDVDLLPRTGLKELVEEDVYPSVSIFMPTSKIAVQVGQDPIRFAGLLKRAQGDLAETGVKHSEIRDLLMPAYDLLDNANLLFWKYQANALAVFVSSNSFRSFRLPFTTTEYVGVSNRFYVKPLFNFFSPGYFYMLQLGKETIRLIQATPGGMRQMEPYGRDLDELLDFNELRRLMTFQTDSAVTEDLDDKLAYRGEGIDIDGIRDELYRYFRKVDNTLFQFLKNERAPLLLTGIKKLFPIYREANSYEHLVVEPPTEDFMGVTDDQMYAQAWSILEPSFNLAMETAVASFDELRPAGRASSDVSETVKAALTGRIDVLFLAQGLEQWGKVSYQTMEVTETGRASTDARDLSDLAAVQTLVHAGTVHVIEPSQVPGGGRLAATFRY